LVELWKLEFFSYGVFFLFSGVVVCLVHQPVCLYQGEEEERKDWAVTRPIYSFGLLLLFFVTKDFFSLLVVY
jgi:hypothetical protein